MTQHADKTEGYKVLMLEKALRLLDPALPPVQVKLSTAALRRGAAVMYGTERVYEVPWQTEGPGVPYVIVERSSANAPRVDPPILQAREGKLYVTFDAVGGLQPVGRYDAQLQFTGGTVKAEPDKLDVDYRVVFPNTALLWRVGAGALSGMLILGGLRLLLSVLFGHIPMTLQQIDIPYIWNDAMTMQFHTLPFIGALVLILAGLYGSYRLLLNVMSQGEV
jgi:hypothetical protein